MYICLKFLLLLFKFNEVSSACMFVDEKESSYLILLIYKQKFQNCIALQTGHVGSTINSV